MENPSAPGAGGVGTMDAARGGAVPGNKAAMAKDGRWRAGLLAPLLFLLGSTLWLIGSACFVGSQERYLLRVLPGGLIGTGAVIDSGLRTATWILWIIASIFFVLGSLVHLANAFAQAAIVTLNNKRPGIAKWAIVAAIVQLIATTIILIGSCVWSGSSLNSWSAGAMLLLIGYTLWGHALVAAFSIAYVVSTVVPMMPDYKQRRYAWASVTSTLVLVVSMILMNIACILLVVRDPPGIALAAALLFLIASVYNWFGWILNLRGNAGFYTPVWGFTTAAYATSGTLAGAAAGGAAGAAMADKGMHSGMNQPRAQLAAEPANSTGMGNSMGMGMGTNTMAGSQPQVVV